MGTLTKLRLRRRNPADRHARLLDAIAACALPSLAAGRSGRGDEALRRQRLLAGGRLLVGSLATLAEAFPQSRLTLDPVGAVFGEAGLGPVSHAVASGLEGMLFAGCVVAAIARVRSSAASGDLDGRADGL